MDDGVLDIAAVSGFALSQGASLIINQPPLTLLGKLFIGLIAVVVATFAGVEFYAVRKQQQAFG